MIVDAQIHIWGADSPLRPWPYPDKAPHRPVPFTADDALREMDAAGVDAAILVPPGWEGERNDLALQAVRSHPSRFAAMGMFDAMAPSARDTLALWRNEPGMLGFRFSAQDPKYRTVLDDGRMEWVWEASERLALPVGMISVVLDEALHVAGFHGPDGLWLDETRGHPVEWSFCATSVRTREPFVVESAPTHPYHGSNPLVTQDGVRCYAGVPLISRLGHVLGNLCVVGLEEREFSDEDIAVLRTLAAEAIRRIELRRIAVGFVTRRSADPDCGARNMDRGICE